MQNNRDDPGDRGLLESTGVLCMGEFGRRPIGRPIKIENSLDDTTAEPIRELW
jgi:hypothetical protein